MNQISPNWRIAQQISRRHSLISMSITLPLFLMVILMAIILLKLLGYQESGLLLHRFFTEHSQIIAAIAIFVHLVPVNLYAIIRVFNSDFKDFALKIEAKNL